jgi:hypothetical protein
MKDRGKKTKTVSRQHHFVPCWYLQHWCGPNGRLLRARKTPSGILFDEPLPKNVGREKDLNTVFGSPGNPGLNLEDQVTRILDDPFSVLHQKMVTEGVDKLTDDERVEVARQLCALQVRNPRIIRDLLKPDLVLPSKSPSNLTIQELKEHREYEQQYRKKFNSDYDFSKFISQMLLRDLDKDAEILLPKQWVVLQTHPPHGNKNLLITGELPFIATLGFGVPKSTYIFPMTPSLALVFHQDLKFLLETMYIDKPWGFAVLNFCAVSKNQEVYFRNPGHKKFIERFLGTEDTLPKDDKAQREQALHRLYSDFLRFIRGYMIDDLGIDVSQYSS